MHRHLPHVYGKQTFGSRLLRDRDIPDFQRNGDRDVVLPDTDSCRTLIISRRRIGRDVVFQPCPAVFALFHLIQSVFRRSLLRNDRIGIRARRRTVVVPISRNVDVFLRIDGKIFMPDHVIGIAHVDKIAERNGKRKIF